MNLMDEDCFISYSSIQELSRVYCSSRDVDILIDKWDLEIESIASELNIPKREVLIQIFLHLPFYKCEHLVSYNNIPLSLRNNLFNRFSSYCEDKDVYSHSSFCNLILGAVGSVKKINGTYCVESDGKLINLLFKEVDEDWAEFIENRLHYLRAYRSCSIFRLGLFIEGAKAPICYASFSVMDRLYKIKPILSIMERHIEPIEVINMSRVYGCGFLPKNTMSSFISLVSKFFSARKYKAIVTSVNPFLKFNGFSMMASGFQPYALCPVFYGYCENGNYRTRRQGFYSSSRIDAPKNVLFLKDITTRKKIFPKNNLIFKISTMSHENIYMKNSNEDSLEKNNLEALRGRLERVWSDITKYHKTTVLPNDPISKGQCGVTSAYLASELEKAGYDVLFCEGDVFFPDDTAPIFNHCWIKIPSIKFHRGYIIDLIIDLTADQTGYKKSVICEPLSSLVRAGVGYTPKTEKTLRQVQVNHLNERLHVLQEYLKALEASEGDS